MNRTGGILLHPTSLPSRYGIGDLGPSAEAWVDWLYEAGCGLWQMLPLGPIGLGNSPYQSFSSHAGNELLISPDWLVSQGLLSNEDLESQPDFPEHEVDYESVRQIKWKWLSKAAQQFRSHMPAAMKKPYAEFLHNQAAWLNDYALFMTLHDLHPGQTWDAWPQEIVQRDAKALQQATKDLADQIEVITCLQFLFDQQMRSLRQYAHKRGLLLIGDAPIFVAYHSADVWAHQSLFHLDSASRPTIVAGVPPDYFSRSGQLWGNPIYRWDVMAKAGYAWWVDRLRSLVRWVDIIRLDHFRGFESYWAVPSDAKTAEAGHWVAGPRNDFFNKVGQALGKLPFIAEDLGIITPEVTQLRQDFDLPGMKVLQFGFEGGSANRYLPHHYDEPCVVYTGTHDNDTSLGWYQAADEPTRDFTRRYLSVDGSSISWDMIRLAWSSTAPWAIAPLQDVLSLGSEARMNRPGTQAGNWAWRFTWEQLHAGLAQGMREIGGLYDRL